MREAVEYVKANPGCNRTAVYAALSIGENKKKSAVDEAVRLGFLAETHPDARTSALHASERDDFNF
jgi:hypothetical protein